MAPSKHRRVQHLINLGAFTKKTMPGGLATSPGSSLEEEVSRMLQQWEDERRGFKMVKTTISYDTLRERRRDTPGLLPLIMEHPDAAKGFKRLASSSGPTAIVDPRGIILGYQFRIHQQLLEESNKATEISGPPHRRQKKVQKKRNGSKGIGQLPNDTVLAAAAAAAGDQPVKDEEEEEEEEVGQQTQEGEKEGEAEETPAARGQSAGFQTRHYAVWADQNPTYMESRELGRDGQKARDWLASNQELFDHCSQELRFLCP